MADIMGGIVNDVDMRKADHTNNEQAETHREDSLKDDVNVLGGNRQMSGVRLLHVKLLGARDRF
jgi:hypothetical protein